LFESVRGTAQALAGIPGVEVRVIGAADEFTAEDAPAWDPVRPTLFRVVGPPRLGYSPDLGTILQREAADVVHSHGLWMYTSLAALRASRRSGSPRVISPRGMLDPWALRRRSWRKRIAYTLFERRNIATAAVVHALTDAEADAVRQLGLGCPIAVIPNGVAIDDRACASAPPWEASDRPVMLFVGRLHPKKGLPALIAAWTLARSSLLREHWRLAVVGWDQDGHRAELEDLTRAAGLEDSILFCGPAQGELKRACFQHAQAFILPSVSEGMPMAVLEAWANALPVILTPACHLPAGVAAGAALEAEPDPASLASALAAMASMSSPERRQMGQRGHALVESAYAWPTIASRMAKVYQWILGGGAAPEDVRHA
jgi:poly(glycerol-phosphate) alpha-glucosyltransferase